mmetsp:Transcript_22160/g.30455  ORF Transcript_22160/g.30455 Transcript_22160/m.30455 type:complete len:202 (-) Transcript_22160:53-658(-)
MATRLGRVSAALQDPNETWKVVTLGAQGVGKSSFTFQFVDHRFVEDYDPTIEDCFRKMIDVDDVMCFIDLFDSAGVESLPKMKDQYLHSADGFLMIYSITSTQSFDTIEVEFENVRHIKLGGSNIPWVLIGNKCDLAEWREVPSDIGSKLAEIKNAPFFETSAKQRINIEGSVHELVRLLRHKDLLSPLNPKKKKMTCTLV